MKWKKLKCFLENPAILYHALCIRNDGFRSLPFYHLFYPYVLRVDAWIWHFCQYTVLIRNSAHACNRAHENKWSDRFVDILLYADWLNCMMKHLQKVRMTPGRSWWHEQHHHQRHHQNAIFTSCSVQIHFRICMRMPHSLAVCVFEIQSKLMSKSIMLVMH